MYVDQHTAPERAVRAFLCIVRLPTGGIRGHASRVTSETPNG